MKKQTKYFIFVILGIIVFLFLIRTIYKDFNFEKDKQTFVALISTAGSGNIVDVLDEMKEIENLTNPIINFRFQSWKKKMYARFVTKKEVIENTSGNKIINDISNIYRDYWRTELLKDNPKSRTDTALYIALTNYILSNHLTNISFDSLSNNIKDDTELKKIILAQGFNSDFKDRNGFQELFIWKKESIKDYKVVLPKEIINTKVIFIEEFHLTGYDDYATCGNTQVGGWAIKESATLYCNDGYDLSSEKFSISYLKHESLHFTDLNNYPNLSSADLEYRAKLIELIYCSEKSIRRIITEFIHGADSSDRSHSHPYANSILIKNMSKLLFNTKFESDLNKWSQISVGKINRVAATLYKESEKTLQKDKKVSVII